MFLKIWPGCHIFQFQINIKQCYISRLKGVNSLLYPSQILVISNNIGLLHEAKILSKTLKMKDLGEALFVLCVEIYRDKSHLDCLKWHILIMSSRGLV